MLYEVITIQRHDLFGRGEGRELRLFEQSPDLAPSFQGAAGFLIEPVITSYSIHYTKLYD